MLSSLFVLTYNMDLEIKFIIIIILFYSFCSQVFTLRTILHTLFDRMPGYEPELLKLQQRVCSSREGKMRGGGRFFTQIEPN